MDEKIGLTEWFRAKGLSEISISNYLFYYGKFGGANNMNQSEVNSFLAYHKHTSMARAFIRNYIDFLVQYGKEYHSDLDLDKIRAIILQAITGRKPRKIPSVLSEEQILSIEREFPDERNKLMLLVSFYGGLRIAELIDIRPFDFDWNKWDEVEREKMGRLKVRGKNNKERFVFVPPSIMLRVGNWIQDYAIKKTTDPSRRLFKVGIRRWQQLLGKASKKALGFHVNPHLIRHSSATWLLNKGFSLEQVKEYLGHEDINSTMIYMHISLKDIESKYNKILANLD